MTTSKLARLTAAVAAWPLRRIANLVVSPPPGVRISPAAPSLKEIHQIHWP